MSISAVIFDIDGVLIDSFEANLKFFQNLMIKFGYTPPTREEFPKYFALTMMESIKAMTQSTSNNEIMKIWKAGSDRESFYPMELISAPTGVNVVLEALSKKYLLGIVTGRIKSSIFTVPQLAVLEKYFKTIVSYEDTSYHKPHPEPLLLATKRLQVHPNETIYIGDNEIDLKSARAAGMKVIIYGNQPIDGADANTSDFTAIPRIITTI